MDILGMVSFQLDDRRVNSDLTDEIYLGAGVAPLGRQVADGFQNSPVEILAGNF